MAICNAPRLTTEPKRSRSWECRPRCCRECCARQLPVNQRIDLGRIGSGNDQEVRRGRRVETPAQPIRSAFARQRSHLRPRFRRNHAKFNASLEQAASLSSATLPAPTAGTASGEFQKIGSSSSLDPHSTAHCEQTPGTWSSLRVGTESPGSYGVSRACGNSWSFRRWFRPGYRFARAFETAATTGQTEHTTIIGRDSAQNQPGIQPRFHRDMAPTHRPESGKTKINSAPHSSGMEAQALILSWSGFRNMPMLLAFLPLQKLRASWRQ